MTTHFTARVRLSRQAPETVAAPPPGEPAESIVEAANIYRVFFHGPAYQVLERAWLNEELNEHQTVGQFSARLPINHYPPDRPLAMAPRLIELCFQTAALREVAGQGRIGLPLHVEQVCLYGAPHLADGPLHAVVTSSAGDDGLDAEVVDAAGNRYLTLRGYKMVAHPDAVDAEPLMALHAVGAV